MDAKQLQSTLLEYVALSRLWQYLQRIHSDEALNDLMVKLIDLEEKILSHFGLPATFGFGEYLQFLGLKKDFCLDDLEETLKELESAAQGYLVSEAKTDLELIRRAQDHYLYIQEVLPETSLKLKSEPYYLFLYEEYLLTRTITPETFWKEVQTVARLNLSQRIYRLLSVPDYINTKEYHNLSSEDLIFLDAFLTYYPEFEKEQKKNSYKTSAVIRQ